MSTAAERQHWPPRSPFEALLSSPNGRRKVQQHQNRTSPSPSPLKKSSKSSFVPRMEKEVDCESPIDEEEDEETLQLRLATLEARLKLKRLQSRKAKASSTSSGVEDNGVGRLPNGTASVKSSRMDGHRNEEKQPSRSELSANIQVAVSPERKRISKLEPRSPGRVLLGIDKGLKGKNVSLRRAPPRQTQSTEDDNPFGGDLRKHLSRSDQTWFRSIGPSCDSQPKKQTFSERIAETRQQDKDQRAQKERIDKLRKERSKGFGVQQQELDAFKSAVIEADRIEPSNRHGTSKADRGFTRDEVIKASTQPSNGLLHRNHGISGVRNTRLREGSFTATSSDISRQKSSASSRTTATSATHQQRPSSPHLEKSSKSRSSTPPGDNSLFESFSSTHLSKRILPSGFLTRTLFSKTIVTIPSLLRDIKSPSYNLPSSLEESDFVVFGTIASKSSPLKHKDARKTNTVSNPSSLTEAAESESNTKGRYMVFTLTDLEWTIDLYLFTTAYTRFWKLTPGTLIAILNPSIMPPPPGKVDTGRFSLVLNSSDDTILEIGTARDLGFCKAVRKDGKVCEAWVNSRHTAFCEWHVDRGVEKCRRGRMEVQGMSAPFAPGGKKGGRTGMFGGKRGGNGEKEDGLIREGAQYDRQTRSTYFMAPGHVGSGRSAARLLDADEEGIGARGREERVRKRLADREREREIARRLGEGGKGTGAEYLRARSGDNGVDANGGNDNVEAPDAGALGLLGNRARNVHLSPLKRRREKGGEMEMEGKKAKCGRVEVEKEKDDLMEEEDDELDIV